MRASCSKQIFGGFRPSLSQASNYIEDASAFRGLVALSFALSYGFSLVAFLVLPLMPSQKADAQWRKRAWPVRPVFGVVALALLGAAFLYSVSVTLLTMVPSTACLEFVGGEGCDVNAIKG